MSEQKIIDGTIENIIYHNNENGYTVFTLASKENDSESDGENITCVANMDMPFSGEEVKLLGEFIFHSQYGEQFKVLKFSKSVPKNIIGIEKYLGSGLIKGVGEKMAKKIVAKFGEATFNVISDHPEKLSEIKGITIEKAIAIGEVFVEQEEQRRAIIYLQDFGISPTYCIKIYSKYKEKTISIITENPYKLADEIHGIGFTIADSIAFKVGFDKISPFRIKAAIKYVLSKATSEGHVYLPKDILVGRTIELVEMAEDFVDNCIIEMQMEQKIYQEIIDDVKVVYLNTYYYAESFTAKRLNELSSYFLTNKKHESELEQQIKKEAVIELDEKQKEAVIASLMSGVLVITGGPGTGKTTTINTIIKILENEGMKIELAAPTGRATKRMTEATGKDAKTIHRLLGVTFGAGNGEDRPQYFEKNDQNKIETDVIIVDETSMVDIMLMYNLLKAIESGTRLILVGDADQLPSIGAGNVLKDIIASGVIKVIKLTNIFRQAQESAIVMNAHKINKGTYPILNEKHNDFFFIQRRTPEEVISELLQLTCERIPKFLGTNDIRNIQILTPMRKNVLGVTNLNLVLQAKLNPPSSNKIEKEFRATTFREGDKVMQIKNNYNMVWRVFQRNKQVDEGTGVYNGDEGIISKISLKDESVTVLFDDGKVVYYNYTQLEELELSYAVTIHKSQGSEYKVVIIPVFNGPPMLLNRNLIYTAVTRAKQLVVLVGLPEALYAMIDNNKEIGRYSALKDKLEKFKFLG